MMRGSGNCRGFGRFTQITKKRTRSLRKGGERGKRNEERKTKGKGQGEDQDSPARGPQGSEVNEPDIEEAEVESAKKRSLNDQ